MERRRRGVVRAFAANAGEGGPSSQPHAVGEGVDVRGGGSLVRAYSMTGGRTRSDGANLAIETLVVTTPKARREPDSLMFERLAISEVADSPISVAEVAARVGIPLGVARVIVGDMTSEGLLDLYRAPQLVTEVSLIKRLIEGVRAL